MEKFGVAVEALREGKLVTREGWNGKGMFVCKQVPAEISMNIVPNMQSLPLSAREEFIRRHKELIDKGFNDLYNSNSIKYCNQMVIIKSDNTIDSWVPSSSDIFAEDWIILG